MTHELNYNITYQILHIIGKAAPHSHKSESC